ncbi:MAG: hypothetical protein GY847_25050 [Proteobacteria bacterium]|nr:hypothetical protein [Pseudomonadota bacterium]
MKDSQLSTDELIRYCEGEVTRSEAQEIEDRLADNALDRKRLSKLQQMTQGLKEADEELENIDFVPHVREAIKAVSVESLNERVSKRWRIATLSLAACFAAMVGLSIFWSVTQEQKMLDSDQFRVKADGPLDLERENWINISAFLISDNGSPKPLEQQMRPDDALLFSYTNLGDKPFGYLMIFGVNAEGEVFWYYPAYTEEQTDPAGIPIHRAARDVELLEKIQHKMTAGPLVIYGLFTDQSFSVSRIEKIITDSINNTGGDPNQLQRLPIEDSGQYIIKTRITP